VKRGEGRTAQAAGKEKKDDITVGAGLSACPQMIVHYKRHSAQECSRRRERQHIKEGVE
jgi:hypothetical protein